MKIRIQPRESNPERGVLYVECPHGGECGFAIATLPALEAAPRWHWNGNREKPTITPSIQCKGCPAHLQIADGRVTVT